MSNLMYINGGVLDLFFLMNAVFVFKMAVPPGSTHAICTSILRNGKGAAFT